MRGPIGPHSGVPAVAESRSSPRARSPPITDRPDSPDPKPTDQATRLPSARDTATGDEARPSGRPKRGESRRGQRRGAAPTPRPARDAAPTEPLPAGPEPDVAEASFEVGDEAWVVRVLGRAGGSRDGATPLLLLGFWAPDSGGADHIRELLIVGRALSELTDSDLRAAHGRAGPPRADPERGQFFPDAAEQRRRS